MCKRKLPEVIDLHETKWVRNDIVQQREAKITMLESQLQAAEDTRDMRQAEADLFFQLTKELRVERDEARHKLAQAESVIELGIPKEHELQQLRDKVQVLMEAGGEERRT